MWTFQNIITCYLYAYALTIFDYSPQVLLISDHTYPRVQYEGGNKMRAGSINLSLVQCVLQSCVCAIVGQTTDVFVWHKYYVHIYSAVQTS